MVTGGVVIRVADKERVELRKQEIALKAASLFVKKGYHQTSIRDIAYWCGISVGALYYYIKSKEDILSLFREITSSMLSKFTEQRLEELFKMSPPEALDAAIEDLITFIDETQDFTLFWYQETKNLKSEELNRLLKYENEVVDLLRRLLQWGVDTHYFKIDDVNLVAQDIMVLCDMWAFRRWSLRKDYNVEHFKHDQKKIISGIVHVDRA